MLQMRILVAGECHLQKQRKPRPVRVSGFFAVNEIVTRKKRKCFEVLYEAAMQFKSQSHRIDVFA